MERQQASQAELRQLSPFVCVQQPFRHSIELRQGIGIFEFQVFCNIFGRLALKRSPLRQFEQFGQGVGGFRKQRQLPFEVAAVGYDRQFEQF